MTAQNADTVFGRGDGTQPTAEGNPPVPPPDHPADTVAMMADRCPVCYDDLDETGRCVSERWHGYRCELCGTTIHGERCECEEYEDAPNDGGGDALGG